MKAKKNPEVDLRRNTSLFFAVGLNLMLFLTWAALEMKSYEKEEIAINVLEVEQMFEEEIPTTNINTPPPPPPPKVASEVITIVEDVAEIEETVIKSTEITMEDVIEEAVAVEEVEVEEVEEDITVPFAVVEKGWEVRLVQLAFSSAFDRVSHAGLSFPRSSRSGSDSGASAGCD